MSENPQRVLLQDVRDLLEFGTELPFSVLDPQDRLLLKVGQRLIDEAQFDALVDRGAWVDKLLADVVRAARGGGAGAPVSDAGAAGKQPVSLFDRWEHLIWEYDKLSRGLARSQLAGSTVLVFWDDLRQLVDTDPDVALFFCMRQNDNRFALYAQQHAIHCAVLCLLAARLLGWPVDRIDALCCAALTMNLAMQDLQAQLAEQEDPPNTRQRERINSHPEGSVDLLKVAGVTDPVWLLTVLQHHEQDDGSGYPKGLRNISPPARLLRLADVYMAKVSARAKRPAMAPLQAMRQLFQQHPGDPLAAAMIKSVGVHPPGALVQLQSGEVAIVIRRPAAGPHPVVATLGDRHGRPCAETHRRDSALPEYAVQGPLLDTRFYARVLPERVYGLI
jgi:hypothetical protein